MRITSLQKKVPYDPAVVIQLLQEAMQGGPSVDGVRVFADVAEQFKNSDNSSVCPEKF